MIKVKTVRFKNYCGYRDTTFDFTNTNGSVKNLALFFGANGCGKSNALRAIELLTSAHTFKGRTTSILFRKFTYHPDYDPDVENYRQELKRQIKAGEVTGSVEQVGGDTVEPMAVEGVFETDDGDKRVLIETSGVKINELPPASGHIYSGHSHFIDADHPMNLQKFQFAGDENQFLDLAKTVYGFDCELGRSVIDKGIRFATDFILHKYGDKVHFKRMSAGEKKIATLIRWLCDPDYADLDIILVDNIEMHIYFQRHAKMIDKLLELFPKKQLICTTHSPILVGCESMGIEAYVDKNYLYGIESYIEKDAICH